MNQLEELIARDVVVRVPRKLRNQALTLVRDGTIARLLPGVVAPAPVATNWRVRARAVSLYDPNAVLTAATAARLSFWPDCPLDQITYASASHRRMQRTGFLASRRLVPVDLCVRGSQFSITVPAMTALDLTTEADAEPIDRVLRTKAATLAQIQRCLELSAGRSGNVERRRVVIDSAMEPWSESERLLHRIMRRLSLRHRWRSNYPVRVGEQRYYLDVAIPALRIAIEADGFEFHSSRPAFEGDRSRQNQLVLDGWTVLRFTWRQLTEDPVACGQQILRAVHHAVWAKA